MSTLYTVQASVDLPDGTSETDVETAVAMAIATYFAKLGLPGNSTVTLISAIPDATVLDPTPPQASIPNQG